MAYSFRLFLACLLGLLLPQLAAAADVRNEMISKQTDKLRIEIQYPVIGQPRADADISGRSNWRGILKMITRRNR